MAQPTETTPLVLRRTDSSSHTLPPLTPVVNRIRLHGLQLLDEDLSIFSSPSASVPAQVAFKMIVLLRLYLLAKVHQPSESRDIWEQWSKERTSSLDAEDLERRCMTVWEEFLRVSRSTQEIEDCLWSAYPLEEGGSSSVRGMPFNEFLSHELVTLSLLQTWTHGKVSLLLGLSSTDPATLRSVATPRVVHAVDILLQLVYLALLSDYIIFPPRWAVITTASGSPSAKEVFLMIYSTASLFRTPTFLLAPFVLVAGAFFSSLPHNPLPGDTSYSVLQWAILLHVLLLHLPQIPSPNFLFSPQVTLPLATLIWHEFTRTLYPAVLFYLPATLFTSFFLSLALEDSVPHFPPLSAFAGPSPMEVRVTFIILWGMLVSFMIASSVLLVLFSASLLPNSSRSVRPWDRYSVVVGLRSRRIFATAVAAYSASNYFPPPFNLLQIIIVYIPRRLLRLFGRKESPFIEQVEGILWNLTTGLLAFVVAGCWLWTVALPLTPFLGQ
ncbi:hypothetical protein EI94DRAFT_1568566 [Lactarius quietus]|nr:hypothetical protein EI94DRAFT_1568566 [Lactarius quietus]